MIETLGTIGASTAIGRWWRTGIANRYRWERRARHWRLAWALVRGRLGAARDDDWHYLRYDLQLHLAAYPLGLLCAEDIIEELNEALDPAEGWIDEDDPDYVARDLITDDDICRAVYRVYNKWDHSDHYAVCRDGAVRLALKFARERLDRQGGGS